MNIEIANRLLQLRKEHKLSQEDLAAKLNISRQAVSKWERAEASPDTDNLIELSKLYSITLDELLTGEKTDSPESANGSEPADTPPDKQEESPGASSSGEGGENASEADEGQKPGGDRINFRKGIHIHSADGDKVDIGFNGVHVEDKNGEKVHVGFDGIYVNDKEQEPGWQNYGNGRGCNNAQNKKNHPFDWDGNYQRARSFKFWYAFPYPLLAGILFFVFGFLGGWAWSWILFLTIPLYYTTISAIEKSNPNIFCYPVLALVVFFLLGFWGGLWHPGWLVFLTISFYYWLVSALMPKYRYNHKDDYDPPNMV